MRTQEQLQRHGIGMTSQRTRERLIERLYEEGLSNPSVLEVIRRTPRHLFVDEALAHRAMKIRLCRLAIIKPSPNLIWSGG